jgi:hypothetical protein
LKKAGLLSSRKKLPSPIGEGLGVRSKTMKYKQFINLTLNPSPLERDFKNRELNTPP